MNQKDYQKGYRAGIRRGRIDGIAEERRRSEMTDREFFDEAMLRLIPEAFNACDWKMGGEKVTIWLTESMRLAARLAALSVKERRKHRS